MMKLTVIRDLDSFRALKDEWNALLENSSGNTLFLSWDWMFYYYENMCKDQELFLILVRNDKGELKGVAPFILREKRIITKKIFLEVIGQGYSYYVGIISNNDSREDVYREILLYLFANQGKWNLINFIHLANDEKFKTCLKNHSKECGYLYRETIHNPCKVVSLKGQFDEYVSGLDERFAKRLKYYLRSIYRDFEVELSVPEDEESLRIFWDAFLELHEQRIHNKGTKTILSNRDFKRFYYSVAHAAWREKKLSLVALTLNKEISAVLFGIIWNKTFYFLNIGYKEYSKYSLGLLLPVMCIERAINDGLEYFDFLGGGGDYKGKLGGVDKGGRSIQVMRPMILLETKVRRGAGKVARKILRRGMLSRTKEDGLL